MRKELKEKRFKERHLTCVLKKYILLFINKLKKKFFIFFWGVINMFKFSNMEIKFN